MTADQIQALIAFVHAAMNAAVAEANNKDEWRHSRLYEAERELVAALSPSSGD
jgi:hypothetical protein